MLLVLAVVLIAHGEPQPSSRPSGTSVGVSGTATATGTVPALLYLRGEQVEFRQQQLVRKVVLPAGASPRSIVSGRGLSVVLAELGGRQRAYSVDKNLKVRDLGYADAALPAAVGPAAVIVEAALDSPGELPVPSASASPGGKRSTASNSSKPPSGEPDLRNYAIRRYDSSGNPVGPSRDLPPGTMAATDTLVGLVVWQPVNRVFDAGVEQESLSAAAILIRPDDTLRDLGPVHPLAANSRDLLVWDVALRRFGVMPLNYVTSTATSTASPESAAPSSSGRSADASTAAPRPTTVAGVRWFLPTRGMVLVTGPAAFNADGSAFAVYAQVGARRRLVVAQLQNLGTDQVQVLALAAPTVKATATPSNAGGTISPSNTASTQPTTPSATADAAALAPDGYPVAAPLAPIWWNGLVVGLGTDGAVIGYRPGGVQSSLLDLGLTEIRALAAAP